jgi:TrmH family RNA methyltransferase
MITGTSNQQMKQLTALLKKSKERKENKAFVVEGTKMVAEAPKAWLKAVYVAESYEASGDHAELLRELSTAAKGHYKYELVSDSVFKSVSDTQTPQGIMAIVQMPEYELSDLLKGDKTHLLILESIQDPGNLGTMVRTGEGAGITGVIMNKTTVDLFNPKTIRSTMGSIYRMPFYVAEELGETLAVLHEAGVKLYAAHLKGEHSYDEENYTGACGFLIGNEGNGLSDEIANLADTYIKIPMEGQVESLNAAISATLLMYEANRQRRHVAP